MLTVKFASTCKVLAWCAARKYWRVKAVCSVQLEANCAGARKVDGGGAESHAVQPRASRRRARSAGCNTAQLVAVWLAAVPAGHLGSQGAQSQSRRVGGQSWGQTRSRQRLRSVAEAQRAAQVTRARA